MHWLSDGTMLDLQAAAAREIFTAFHFIGHGDAEGEEPGLWIPPQRNSRRLRLKRVTATEVVRTLKTTNLTLVVLSSCHGATVVRDTRGRAHTGIDDLSSVADDLVRLGIPAVVAIQGTIADAAAVLFAKHFYASLAKGAGIEVAVTEARKAMALEAVPADQWSTIVLYLRSTGKVRFSSLPHTRVRSAAGGTNDVLSDALGKAHNWWLAHPWWSALVAFALFGAVACYSWLLGVDRTFPYTCESGTCTADGLLSAQWLAIFPWALPARGASH